MNRKAANKAKRNGKKPRILTADSLEGIISRGRFPFPNIVDYWEFLNDDNSIIIE
jgi:hypothetical protein